MVYSPDFTPTIYKELSVSPAPPYFNSNRFIEESPGYVPRPPYFSPTDTVYMEDNPGCVPCPPHFKPNRYIEENPGSPVLPTSTPTDI